MVHKTTCRLCACEDAHMVSVFKKDKNNIQYAQKITECVPILIYRTDPLSKVICEQCITQIESFHKYRTLVLKVTDQYISQIKQNVEKRRVQLYLNALEGVFAPDRHVAPQPVTIIDVNGVNKTKLNDDIVTPIITSKTTNEDNFNQNTLKILTPFHINKTVENISLDQTIDDEKHEQSDTIYQPLSLLQCTLKTINSTIHSDDYNNFNVSSRDDETEAILESRKRKLEHNASLLEHLLCSPDLGIKRIKLEMYDTSKTSINISMKNQSDEVFDDHLSHNLLINFKKHRLNCKYCPDKFSKISDLASHEITHMHVFLGARVESTHWRNYEREDVLLRNDWLYRNNAVYDPIVVKEEIPDSEEISILVEPMIYDECQSEESQSEPMDQEMTVPEPEQEHTQEPENEEESEENIPTSVGPPNAVIPDSDRLVNGISFHKLKKEERYPLYGSVMIDGVKRKYCRFCKRDFKDTYAVDVHFMKNRCVRICKFCEAYFLKPDLTYFDHITTHKDSPYYNSLIKGEKKNYYMQKKLNKIRAARMEMKRVKEGNISPIKMRELFERQNFVPALVKSEPSTSRQYTHITTLKRHVSLTNTEPKPIRTQYCRKCFKIFHDPDQLDVHYDQCVDNYNYDSSISKIITSSPIIPFSHKIISTHTIPQKIILSKSHKSDPYKCSICGSVFPNWQSRNSHMRIHKMQNRIKIIPPVNIATPKPISLRPKMMDENLARLVKNPQITIRPSSTADQSSASFRMSVENIKQEDSQDSNRKYTCIPCGECFPTKSLMYTHKKSQCKGSRSESEMLLPLPSKNGSLHEITSESDKGYRCVPCNKRFHNKASLYIHKKNTCNKTKVFECPFCKRKFGTESQYTSHILYNHPE